MTRIKERDSPELSKVLSIFNSLAAIKKDKHLAASVALIDYVVSKGVFKERDAQFYRDTQARTYESLSVRQRGYRQGLNRKIIQSI